ncbi:MAG: CoA activase [Bacteroidetes bacterium]|nr:CoA activase [Bacteroidota bacterium]
MQSTVSAGFHLGLDIGSISVNTVLLDKNRNIVENHYDWCHGKPFHVLHRVISSLINKYGRNNIGHAAVTGTGGELAATLIGGYFVNEIIAHSSSVAKMYPQAKSVIEMGGEDSKLIFMDKDGDEKYSRLSDFSMNTLCAAGTGSFLDQQAKRIGVSIEGEFGEMAMRSKIPSKVAGRCSVFAKSDMIHLQQIATPVEDIVAGLCYAVANNFKSNMAQGKEIKKPVVFQGGVSANLGVRKAFADILDLEDGELIIPEYYASMGAIGALYYIFDSPPDEEKSFQGIQNLEEYINSNKAFGKSLEPLKVTDAQYNKEIKIKCNGKNKIPVYLGIDVGSLSTNVVLIDEQFNVVARRYLKTAGRPLAAIRRGLEEIYEEVGEKIEVIGAGSTGSGRYLTGDFIGADTIQNEITAQATAALAYDKTVDTIFEIGGQDSKYISIDNGVIVDFEMNKACAAGTGSFLEEQAEKLDINIVEEFADLAFSASCPAQLGSRCTVFMESDLNSHQQKGVPKENLVSGLAYSTVQNYLQRVVGDKRIGDKIFFQGGVTNNKAVVSAFEKVTGKPIIVPPHYDVTGAIGAAILAQRNMSPGQKTRFKGFDISKVGYTMDKFTCRSKLDDKKQPCSNRCEIRRIKIEGERRPLFYGARCEKFEVADRKGKGKDIPNLFEERIRMLTGDYKEQPKDDRITIGIPRGLMVYYQQFPFWRTFFEELNFRIILSKPTDHHLVTKSLELLTAETCIPIEVMHGHIYELFKDENIDYIFTPFIVNAKAEKNNPTNNCNCPWIQSYPFMVRSALGSKVVGNKMLIPTMHFRYFDRVLTKELSDFVHRKFGISKAKAVKAIRLADEAQLAFETAVAERGKEVLSNLPDDKIPMVIIGRPYNTGDPELNLGMVEKLMKLNVLPIPLDFLPLKQESIFGDYSMMYWPNGQRIISGGRIIASHEKLHAVYLGNFRCGPDSFLAHYVREEMKGKPYLQIEVDEHKADAGMITRFEAFLDSLKGYEQTRRRKEEIFRPGEMVSAPRKEKVLYVPYMNDAAFVFAAAARSCGMPAEVLPMQTEEDVELGRKYTSSRECFPMICTTGSFLKKMHEPGFQPKKSSFFMPDHNGPCRFGQYNKLQRIIFDRLGFKDVEIISPSNDTSYEDLSGGHGQKFRLTIWKGFVASDLLRKMLQERRPYEAIKGITDRIYMESLDDVVRSVETGCKNLVQVLAKCAERFRDIPVINGFRRPVISIVGEIFMRDNPYCSGNLVGTLEELGAETFMAPFTEWIYYSTYRFTRDSRWKGDYKGVLKSKIQDFMQHLHAKRLFRVVRNVAELERDIHLHDVLHKCNPYIHKDYDGDPALAIGSASGLVETNISGVVNFLPFACMPGTLIEAVSNEFRKDHNNIPWENIAYDGNENTGILSRLQAFMHQAREYCHRSGYDGSREWGIQKLVEHAAI